MLHTRPSHETHTPRLCFGTVQLGMPYGAANQTGMPSEQEAETLIREALVRGITLFDTAQAYGESESRLGAMHRPMAAHGASVITKLANLPADITHVETWVWEQVQQSCERLQLPSLPYLLLHRAEYLQHARLWQALVALQAQGRIGRLGVSVSTPEEARMALNVPEVRCVQVPFNILDTRLAQSGMADLFMQRRDVLVMVRSVFLQGVLTQAPSAWPIGLGMAENLSALLDGWVGAFGRESRADLCLAYARAQGWVDVVVLGMETLAQLHHNVALFETAALPADACAHIAAGTPELPESFLNPALWKKE